MSAAIPGRLPDSSRICALIELWDDVQCAIRAFFHQRSYREVITPVMVRCPGLDQHVEALSAGNGLFLATSPELHMKRLVCRGVERIFQITPAFRDEEQGAHHTAEFLMLEWYSVGCMYMDMMCETEELIRHVTGTCPHMSAGFSHPIDRMQVDQLYESVAGWRPSEDWNEDRYFHDWVTSVEPYLQGVPALFVYDFPAGVSALSRISPLNDRICERFELFIHGIEICNAYTELTDPEEHRIRFEHAAQRRMRQGRAAYTADEHFLRSVDAGLPMCAGNALGVDRLIMALTGARHIRQVSLFPEDIP
jgi:elongation factor P--(R)-beta-lysine ligase